MNRHQCPVCSDVATELNAADYDGVSFDCINCGRFDVTGTALVLLENKTPESRQEALKKARNWSKGRVPELSSQCL